MVCYVYILGSMGKGGFRTYVGWTMNLEQRLKAHNDGKGAKSTRGRNWRLLYAERHGARGEAMRREWHLKRARAFRASVSADARDLGRDFP